MDFFESEMPRVAVLVPVIGARDLTSVVLRRVTVSVWFVGPANGHATTPANKDRKRHWCLILPPSPGIRHHIGFLLQTCFLTAEINTSAITGAKHDVFSYFLYCRGALKMYSRWVAPDGAMIPKQTTIAFVALCYGKDRPKLSFAEERSWEGRC